MRVNTHLRRTFWTLLDQGVVSLGTFLLSVLLARHLAPAEYGVFALLLGMLLLAQVINSSLIFYPMSIRSAVLPALARPRLIGRPEIGSTTWSLNGWNRNTACRSFRFPSRRTTTRLAG